MILFCFALMNTLVSRVWGWLEHHLKQPSTNIYRGTHLNNPPNDAVTDATTDTRTDTTTDVMIGATTETMIDVLPAPVYRRLRCPVKSRPVKGSDNHPNAVLHRHPTKPRSTR